MTYDIIILGAGPAGSTFAREVAKSGLSIMLIDGQDETNKKPCGGLLSPDAQKVLAYFNLSLPKDVLVEPQIFSVKTIDVCSKRIRKYQRCYLNMDRYKFDKWLVSLIPDSVEVCNGKCLDIEEKEGIFNLTIKVDGEKKNVQTKYLVGADGVSEVDGMNLIVSKDAIAEGDYWENIAFVGETLDNKNIIVILPNALCTSGLSIEGKSGEESVGKFTFECHGDANESLTTLPYKIYYPNPEAVETVETTVED